VIRKLTLAAGFGAGYVLGAKAGTERYNQIQAKFRELAGMPAVQDVTSTLADTASTIGDTAKAKVNDTISAAGEKVTGGGSDVVDLGASSSKTKTGARTAAAPMPGAAPSLTAPDV
jgi:predicted nucleic acid-binding Zn ribbon protein